MIGVDMKPPDEIPVDQLEERIREIVREEIAAAGVKPISRQEFYAALGFDLLDIKPDE